MPEKTHLRSSPENMIYRCKGQVFWLSCFFGRLPIPGNRNSGKEDLIPKKRYL